MVFRTDNDNAVRAITPPALKDIVQIQCFYETSDSTMWIGTLDGLIAYKEKDSDKVMEQAHYILAE